MLKAAIEFLLGPPSPAIATLLLVTGLNMLLGILTASDKKATLAQEWKRPIAYILFYIAAHRLDALLIDNLFNWTGSTKLLVVLGLLAKDGRQFIVRVSQWSGIGVPTVLEGRLDQMERGQVNPGYVDGHSLDQQIDNLRQNMDKIKELNRLKQEIDTLTSAGNISTDVPVL